MLKIIFTRLFLCLLTASSMTVAADADRSEPFASVNKETLSQDLFEFLLGSSARSRLAETDDAPTPEQEALHRTQTAKDLIVTEVLAQLAIGAGIDERPRVKTELEIARKTLLAQLMVQDMMQHVQVDEARIRSMYDEQESPSMYRLLIRVSENESEARQALADLKSAQASNRTTQADASQTLKIMETPWVQLHDVFPGLRDEVKGLKVGEFANDIVHQNQQWNIVQLIDKNSFPKQAYDQERDIIKAEIIQAEIEQAIAGLVESASIRIHKPDGLAVDESWKHAAH